MYLDGRERRSDVHSQKKEVCCMFLHKSEAITRHQALGSTENNRQHKLFSLLQYVQEFI